MVLYFCVQALGAKKVKAYFLPSLYTQKISYSIVYQLSQTLKVDLLEKNMDDIYDSFKKWAFPQKAKSISLQNLQSRIRMAFLMAQSNEYSRLLMATSNKSEIAVGLWHLIWRFIGDFFSDRRFMENRNLWSGFLFE